MVSYRYTVWDGSQELDIDADDILDAISEDLLERGDTRQALRRLMQRGMRGQNLMGLQQMLQRLKERRQQKLDQYDLGSFMDQFQKALEDILKLEREGIKVTTATNGEYVFVYTMWLKRTSTQNIVIGGAAGAVPALVGWAAVTGGLALPAWILFAIVIPWS